MFLGEICVVEVVGDSGRLSAARERKARTGREKGARITHSKIRHKNG